MYLQGEVGGLLILRLLCGEVVVVGVAFRLDRGGDCGGTSQDGVCGGLRNQNLLDFTFLIFWTFSFSVLISWFATIVCVLVGWRATKFLLRESVARGKDQGWLIGWG